MERTTMSYDEKIILAGEAEIAFGRASTKEETKAVWNSYYLSLGHRVLGRLLLGKTVDEAVRSPKTG